MGRGVRHLGRLLRGSFVYDYPMVLIVMRTGLTPRGSHLCVLRWAPGQVANGDGDVQGLAAIAHISFLRLRRRQDIQGPGFGDKHRGEAVLVANAYQDIHPSTTALRAHEQR